MALGAVAAFVVAMFMAYTGPDNPQYTRESVLGFFFVLLALPGVGLGSILALVLDRISLRRAEHATVEAADDEQPHAGGSHSA